MEIKDTLNSIEDIIPFHESFEHELHKPSFISLDIPLNNKYFETNPYQLRLYAYYEQDLIGILMSNPNGLCNDLLKQFDYYLAYLFVQPTFQRKSTIRVGTQLIEKLYTTIPGQSILVQAINNSGPFYEKQGFQYLGNFEDSIYYGKNKVQSHQR